VKLTAMGLARLLGERHAQDVFLPECNLGSAWASCRRLDVWVLKKTWSPLTTIGYELKVSRSDFLRDDKWYEYLPYCHELYFVCPRGLIAPEELPENVGLLWASANGRKLYAKRRAVRREPEAGKLVELMSYALMSRSRVVKNAREANGEQPVDYWRRWLLEEQGKQYIGHMVSRRLAERVRRAERAQQEAERRLLGYQRLEGQIREWGLEPSRLSLREIRAHVAGDNEQLREIVQEVNRLGQRLVRLTDGA